MALKVLRPQGVVQLWRGNPPPEATTMAVVEPASALLPAYPATYVGIAGGSGTSVAATPANLLVGPEADITDFVIISLDAGVY